MTAPALGLTCHSIWWPEILIIYLRLLICRQTVRQEVPRLLGEGGSRGAGDAGTGQRLPPQVFRVRRVRRPPPEGRPVCHQAGTALLQA